MHPMAPTLTTMVVSATLAARHAARVPVDPGELERYAQRVLGRRWRRRRFALPRNPAVKLSPAIRELRPPDG